MGFSPESGKLKFIKADPARKALFKIEGTSYNLVISQNSSSQSSAKILEIKEGEVVGAWDLHPDLQVGRAKNSEKK
jgi:hypothetical protein